MSRRPSLCWSIERSLKVRGARSGGCKIHVTLEDQVNSGIEAAHRGMVKNRAYGGQDS
jgi:hypothetical protein